MKLPTDQKLGPLWSLVVLGLVSVSLLLAVGALFSHVLRVDGATIATMVVAFTGLAGTILTVKGRGEDR